MMSDVTDEQFISALREVVKGKEDFVYIKVKPADNTDGVVSPCRYFDHNGNPSCLIGQALFKCGIVVPAALEGAAAPRVLRELTDTSEVVQVAAGRAQAAQDTGAPWGVALNDFEIVLKNG